LPFAYVHPSLYVVLPTTDRLEIKYISETLFNKESIEICGCSQLMMLRVGLVGGKSAFMVKVVHTSS
jgi:hypothetical protein